MPEEQASIIAKAICETRKPDLLCAAAKDESLFGRSASKQARFGLGVKFYIAMIIQTALLLVGLSLVIFLNRS